MKNNLREIKLGFLIGGIVTVFFIIIIRIFFLSVIRQLDLTEKDKRQFLGSYLDKRANIVDKNGELLATDIDIKDLYINKKLIDDLNDDVNKISKALNIDRKSLYNKIKNSRANNVFIKQLTPQEELIAKNIPVASINFMDNVRRYYLHNNLFSNIIGFVDSERDGIIGMEEYYDKYLKENSKPLQLTLDLKIQNVIYTALQQAQEKYNSNFIIGIMTEIKTGNILGAVSLPDYNPNISEQRGASFNRITQGLYELGSVLKIFSVANGLEEKVITKDTVFDISKPIVYDKFKIKDGSHIKEKSMNTGEVFAHSSNLGVAQIAQKLGAEKQMNFLEKVGLLEKMDLDINQVSLPMQIRKWSFIDSIAISYGYGIAITPLHIIQAANAIINNGQFVGLRFSYEKQDQIKKQVISKQTSDIMKNFFELTTRIGTGKQAYIEGYNVGGKTGTAEKRTKGTSGYTRGEYLVSFIGAFPMNDPQYSILVVVDRPKGETKDAGSYVAASVAKQIILNSLMFLDLKPIYQ